MSKICKKCGVDNEDNAASCRLCGATEFMEDVMKGPSAEPETVTVADAPEKESVISEQASAQTVTGIQDTAKNGVSAETVKESVGKGILGALLFSLVGGVLYVLIYQFGYIASLCGLVTFLMAAWGYRKFAKAPNLSVKGLIISALITVLIIFLAEYSCIAIEIYKAYKNEYAITILDAYSATPSFLEDGEVLTAFIKDLAIAYVLSFAAIIYQLVMDKRAKKSGAQKETRLKKEAKEK